MGPLRSLYDGNVMTSMTSLLATLRCHGLDKLFHPAKSLYQYLLYVDETIFLLGKLGTNNRTPIYPDQFRIHKSQSFSLFVQSKSGSNNEQDDANNHTNQHQDFYVENPMWEKPWDHGPPKQFDYQQIIGSQLFFLRFN